MTPDYFVFFAPIPLLFIMALLRFVGCFTKPDPPSAAVPVVLVNCGGGLVNDNTGDWLDDSVEGGTPSSMGSRFRSIGGNVFPTPPTIIGVPNAPNYYGTCRFGSDFSYEFDLPNPGIYTVLLKFAEISPQNGGGPGKRVFNFTVTSAGVSQGRSGYDVTAAANGDLQTHDESFTVNVDSSQAITVRLTQGPDTAPGANLALINAIEILPQ